MQAKWHLHADWNRQNTSRYRISSDCKVSARNSTPPPPARATGRVSFRTNATGSSIFRQPYLLESFETCSSQCPQRSHKHISISSQKMCTSRRGMGRWQHGGGQSSRSHGGDAFSSHLQKTPLHIKRHICGIKQVRKLSGGCLLFICGAFWGHRNDFGSMNHIVWFTILRTT